MSSRLIILLCGIVFSALTTRALGAETFLNLTSEPGETLGGGKETLFTAEQARFFGRSYLDGGIAQFTVEERPSRRSVGTFTFAAPQNTRLGPGHYPGAVEGGFFQLPGQPAMEVSLFSTGCGASFGNFLVKELVPGVGDSPMQSAWIIFEYHCEEFPPGLLGELRWQSARKPIELEAPLGRSVAIGEPIEILIATRTQLEGAAELQAVDLPAGSVFTDLGDGTGRLRWTPQPGQVGAHTVQLHARHSSGAVDHRPMRIVVKGETALILESDPGDSIAQGKSERFDLSNARFEFFNQDIAIAPHSHGYGLTVQAEGVFWSLLFAPPSPYSFLQGTYEDGASRDFHDASRPLLSVQGNLTYCASSQFGSFLSLGRFEVEQLIFEGPKVRSFRAKFESHCAEATAGVRGEIRFNADLFSPVNQPPTLRCAGAEQSCLPPEGAEIPISIELGDPEGDSLEYVVEVDGVIAQTGSRPASLPGNMELIPFAHRFPPGLHTVRVSATDRSGQTNNCFVRVKAQADETPPILECPIDLVVSAQPGDCGAEVNLSLPNATDECGPVHPEVVGVFSLSSLGGRRGTGRGEPSILQGIPSPQPSPRPTGRGRSHLRTTAQPTTSGCTECGPPGIQGRRSDGAPLSAPFPIGDTVVSWSAIDSAGNRAECEQIVRVLDREPPSLTSRYRHPHRKPHQPLEVQLSAVDNCDPHPSVMIVDTATRVAYGPFPSGARFKIWTGQKKEQRSGWRQAGKGVIELRLRCQAEAYSYDRYLNRSPALTLPGKGFHPKNGTLINHKERKELKEGNFRLSAGLRKFHFWGERPLGAVIPPR